MNRDVIVIGAGGFGREALDVIKAQNHATTASRLKVLGVADDSPSEPNLRRLRARGYSFLGSVTAAFDAAPTAFSVVAIGSPSDRRAVAGLLRGRGVATTSVRHPSAKIGTEFQSGLGAIICGGVQVSTNVQLGEYVHLNPGSIVGHDAKLENFVSVNPGAIISGEVEIGARSLVGAGAVVLQSIRVGEAATIGAGAVATREVADGDVVVGIPARSLKLGGSRR